MQPLVALWQLEGFRVCVGSFDAYGSRWGRKRAESGIYHFVRASWEEVKKHTIDMPKSWVSGYLCRWINWTIMFNTTGSGRMSYPRKGMRSTRVDQPVMIRWLFERGTNPNDPIFDWGPQCWAKTWVGSRVNLSIHMIQRVFNRLAQTLCDD